MAILSIPPLSARIRKALKPRLPRRAASRRTLPQSPRKCGVAAADVAAFFDLWAGTNRVVTLYSQGVNQSWQGTDKVNAIINCHLATGRIGIPGAGPFSLDRTAECDGRARGRGARQSACRSYGFFRRRDRSRRPLLGRATYGPARGSQGRRDVRGHRARQHQGIVDHGHQSGGEPAACRSCARRRFAVSISL